MTALLGYICDDCGDWIRTLAHRPPQGGPPMITVIQCEAPGCKARHVVDWAESYMEARRSASRLGWHATAAADYCPEHSNTEGGRAGR